MPNYFIWVAKNCLFTKRSPLKYFNSCLLDKHLILINNKLFQINTQSYQKNSEWFGDLHPWPTR